MPWRCKTSIQPERSWQLRKINWLLYRLDTMQHSKDAAGLPHVTTSPVPCYKLIVTVDVACVHAIRRCKLLCIPARLINILPRMYAADPCLTSLQRKGFES